jgi:hypothetical protein
VRLDLSNRVELSDMKPRTSPHEVRSGAQAVELALALSAAAATGSLVELSRLQTRRMRWTLLTYASLTMYVLFTFLVTTQVQYPSGKWVIVSWDIVDGLMYSALYQFCIERIPNDGPWSHRASRSRRVLHTINELLVVANIVIAFAGGYLDEHVVQDGHWHVVGATCWACWPVSTVALMAFVSLSCTSFLAVRHAFATDAMRMYGKDGGSLDDSKATAASRAAIGLAINNLIAQFLSLTTTNLVMLTFQVSGTSDYSRIFFYLDIDAVLRRSECTLWRDAASSPRLAKCTHCLRT